MNAVDLHTSSRLLSIIAGKLWHDWLLLRSSGPEPCNEECCNAVFGHYSNFNTVLLRADGKIVSIKFIDAEGRLRSSEDMYAELVSLLYKTLENGGNVSDGRFKLSADEVPEFMIECVLSGLAEGEDNGC